MKNILIVFVIIFSNVFAMGESVPASLPLKIMQVSGNNAENAIDRNLSTVAELKQVMFDLGRIYYLATLNIYEDALPVVKISKDIVNWQEVTPQISNGVVSVYFDGAEGRYLSITNSERTVVKEIIISSYDNYKFSFEDLAVDVGVTTADVKVKLSMPGQASVAYAENFDFIYQKKFTNAETNATAGKDLVFKLTRLKPETTYRYQVKAYDASGKMLESNYFGFTTLGQE